MAGVNAPVDITPVPEYVPPTGEPTSCTGDEFWQNGPAAAKLTTGKALTVIFADLVAGVNGGSCMVSLIVDVPEPVYVITNGPGPDEVAWEAPVPKSQINVVLPEVPVEALVTVTLEPLHTFKELTVKSATNVCDKALSGNNKKRITGSNDLPANKFKADLFIIFNSVFIPGYWLVFNCPATLR